MMEEVMFIDGIPLHEMGAELLSWNTGAPNLSNAILAGENYALPSLLHSELAQKPLSITVNVIGKTPHDAMKKATWLINRLNKTVELQMPDGYFYRSALQSISEMSWPAWWIAEFTLSFLSVQHGPYISISPYTAGTPIYYSGTAPAGMKIEFDAPNDIQNMTLKIVKNLETKFGTSVKFSDATELYRALISGNQTQEGSGDPSPDNVRPIHGVTKITVNGVDYVLPRTLYDEDCYDIIKGQGQAKQNLITLDGSHLIVFLYRGTDSTISFTFSIPLKGKKGSVPRCDKFAYSYTGMGAAIAAIEASGNVYFIKIPNTLIGVAYTDTDDQVKTKISNYFADNPVTVLYELATPQTITGTPIPSAVPADTLISVDNGGTVTTTSGNTQQDIQLTSIPSGAHIVLDGIEKIITQNGSNKFADTNLVDFPALEPSETAYAVQVSKPVSNLSVGYYPTYI